MREVVLHVVLVSLTLVGAVRASRTNGRVLFALEFVLAWILVPMIFAPWVFPNGMRGFAMMRIFAGILFLELPTALATLSVFAPKPWRIRRVLGGLGALALVAIAIDVFLVEPRSFQIRHETLRSSRIDEPLRIVVLSDIQTDSPGDYERRVMQTTRSLHPDLVLLPGDFIQLEPGADYRRATRELGRMLDGLNPPLGTFAVRGNVEHAGFVRDLFMHTRVRAFDATSHISVGPIDLVPLSFADSFDPHLVVPGSDHFQVVFGHGPDFMLGQVQAELAVAGHTHGGQVNVPFFGPPITLSTVPRSWAAGGHQVLSGGRHLDISRGIGMERNAAPRFRFRCPPEIVVIDLLPARL